MWGGGKKRPRSTVTRQPDWSGRDRIPRPCELQSHTPGLPNYERASIALASLLGDFQTSMRVAVVLAWVVVVA